MHTICCHLSVPGYKLSFLYIYIYYFLHISYINNFLMYIYNTLFFTDLCYDGLTFLVNAGLLAMLPLMLKMWAFMMFYLD